MVRAAWEQGKLERVYVTETRPLLQGARVAEGGVRRGVRAVSLVGERAAGSLGRRGGVGAGAGGAARDAANGDVANKVGTYARAVRAGENGVPFYAAAPTSTIDPNTPSGDDIPIEERDPAEVTALAAAGATAANPAFDVTPSRYVSAIITENGVASPPYEASLAGLLREEAPSRG